MFCEGVEGLDFKVNYVILNFWCSWMWLFDGRTLAEDVLEYVVIHYELRGTRY
jgi:hypothetical protein